jgi:hypothetical protein
MLAGSLANHSRQHDHAFARHCRKAQIENTRSRSFVGRGIHCRRNHNRGPILISLFSEPRDLRQIIVYLQSQKHFGLRDNHWGRAPRNADPGGLLRRPTW